MKDAILTLNAGSSSLKFGLYDRAPEPALRRMGQVESLGAEATLILRGDDGKQETGIGRADHGAALAAILQALEPDLAGASVAGIGHRIVHGGPDFGAPEKLDAEKLAALEALIPLAPLHQPHNLAAIRAAAESFPDAVQVGCFDTGFHQGRPFVNDTYGLPRAYYARGVRRYGFHGLSYDYITGVLRRDFPDLARGRVVIAHLGNGASMTAVQDGRSVASSMGFSALDGLVMGTRCGQLDPGVMLYLLDQGMTGKELERLLYHESGLLGLSGIGHDMRILLASDDPNAVEALDYYIARLVREVGAMAAMLGGLDGLVFCGGVGENAAPIRARVLKRLAFLGLELDAQANTAGARRIGKGRVEALVIPTDEERVIARAVVSELDGQGDTVSSLT